MRKVPSLLKELCGVWVTHGALIQAALRQSKSALSPVYEQLRTSLADAPAVPTDDTGWRIGGESAFLMAFESEEACVYQIRKRHRNEEVRELIPGDYAGTLITDRGKSYDANELARVIFGTHASPMPTTNVCSMRSAGIRIVATCCASCGTPSMWSPPITAQSGLFARR